MDGINRYHGKYKIIPNSYILQLDALRGMSSIGVAVGHANQVFIGPTTPVGFTFFGLLAQGSVMVFFVLSGFLIGKSISRNIEENGGDSFSVARYAGDRLWRIYPPLLFAVALMFIIWQMAPAVFPSGTTQFLFYNSNYGRHGINFEWPSVLKTLIFRNGFSIGSPDMNGPLWSLSVEVWYYVVAGGIVALLRRPIILGFFAVITWWLVRTNDDFTDYAIVWAAGYLVSVLHNRNALNFQVLFICCAACAIFALLFAGLFAQPDIVAWKQNWIRHFNVAAGMAFASALAALVAGYVNLPKLLVSLFSGTAKFSYTLYLIHVPIFLLTFGVFERIIVGNIYSSVMIAAIGTLVSIFVARGAARIFEDKKLLQRWMLDRNP